MGDHTWYWRVCVCMCLAVWLVFAYIEMKIDLRINAKWKKACTLYVIYSLNLMKVCCGTWNWKWNENEKNKFVLMNKERNQVVERHEIQCSMREYINKFHSSSKMLSYHHADLILLIRSTQEFPFENQIDELFGINIPVTRELKLVVWVRLFWQSTHIWLLNLIK